MYLDSNVHDHQTYKIESLPRVPRPKKPPGKLTPRKPRFSPVMDLAPSFIETDSGRKFYPLDPNQEEISIRDIAHALSNQCRFSGHTSEFYSVAEHSLRVCRYLSDQPRWVQLWGLLHDSSEAYLVDLPSPLKAHPAFEGYLEYERRLMAVICEKYNLPVAMPDVVKHADAVLLSTEARDLMPFVAEHWNGLKAQPMTSTLVPYEDRKQVAEAFLEKFRELTE